jgi:hypothetical protein
MEHLLEQLVQLAKVIDNDYETFQRQIEPIPSRPATTETMSSSATQFR